MANLDTIIELASEQIAINEANAKAYTDALQIVHDQNEELQVLKAGHARPGKVAKRRPVWDGKALRDVTGLYITEQSAPGTERSSKRYVVLDALFKYADEESAGAFNLYQTFIHPDEMTEGRIVSMAATYDVELVADTVDLLCFSPKFYRNSIDGWQHYVATARDKGIRIFAFDDAHTLLNRQGITIADIQRYVKAAKDVFPGCIITGSFGATFSGASAYPFDINRYQGYRQGGNVNQIDTWAKMHPETFLLDLECFRDGTRWTTPAELKAMYKLMVTHPNITGNVAYAFYDDGGDLRNNQSLFESLVVRSSVYWRNR